MVCHAPPPDFTSPEAISATALFLSRIFIRFHLNICYRYASGAWEDTKHTWVRERGFTPVSQTLLYQIYRPHEIPGRSFIVVRTLEEGWVAIDCRRDRWRRLGWFLGGDSRADVEGLQKTVDELDEDCGDGNPGWRYEIPQRLSFDHYVRREYDAYSQSLDGVQTNEIRPLYP